jgi:heptosyltransferase-2
MEPHSIVIRGPNWVGDAVLSVPAIKAVRARFPHSKITLMVRPWVGGLFRSAPFIDEVWMRPRPRVRDWYPTVREIRQRGFDLALLLPNSFESALTVFAAGVPSRVGYVSDGRGFLLTQRVARPIEKRHQVAYYLDLIRSVFGVVEEPTTELVASEAERDGARQLLKSEGLDPEAGLLVLNPGAAFGSAKRWHEDRFAQVADQIVEEFQLQTVVVGSASETPIARRIRDRMKHPAVALTGRTDLETLMGVLSLTSLMITNDSGPMHMGAALGIPTVAIFGSTDAEVTRPSGPRTHVVKHEVSCSPCLLRECPIDHRCMEAVTVDDVFEAAKAIHFLLDSSELS